MLADLSTVPAERHVPLLPTAIFLCFLFILLFIDLGLLNRKAHVISGPQALRQTGIWVAVALGFAGFIYFAYENRVLGLGPPEPILTGTPPAGQQLSPANLPAPPMLMPANGRDAAAMFASGYILELVMSLDNMMVIAIIMTYFKVPHAFQHRLLFWGILGAVVLRGIMIGAGAALIHQFEWVLYLFGLFLLYTAIKLLRDHGEEPDLERNPAVRFARRFFLISPSYEGTRFTTRIDGRLALTPMALALFAIESADVIFAVDSIPAIFSVTRDPFIVLTSNCFAILGLRSIFFAVTAVTRNFPYLKHSMILILAYIGAKMLLPLMQHIPGIREHIPSWDFHIPSTVSLAVILALMLGGIGLSLARREALATDATKDNTHR